MRRRVREERAALLLGAVLLLCAGAACCAAEGPAETGPGVYEVLSNLKDRGYLLAVISGSLNIVLEKFDLAKYFDDVFINELYFDRAGELVGSRPTPFDLDNKAAGLEWLLDKYDLVHDQSVFIGDNFNDLSVARRAGLAIAFNTTCDDLIECAHVRVEEYDLRAILPHILG